MPEEELWYVSQVSISGWDMFSRLLIFQSRRRTQGRKEVRWKRTVDSFPGGISASFHLKCFGGAAARNGSRRLPLPGAG